MRIETELDKIKKENFEQQKQVKELLNKTMELTNKMTKQEIELNVLTKNNSNQQTELDDMVNKNNEQQIQLTELTNKTNELTNENEELLNQVEELTSKPNAKSLSIEFTLRKLAISVINYDNKK